jgi:hypothetical protein
MGKSFLKLMRDRGVEDNGLFWTESFDALPTPNADGCLGRRPPVVGVVWALGDDSVSHGTFELMLIVAAMMIFLLTLYSLNTRCSFEGGFHGQLA